MVPWEDLKGARTARATSSSALSRFPARTVGQAGFATLTFACALAVIPAFAGDVVALIERLTGPSQRVELMTYAHVGQVIHLSADQTMVLSYRDSCIRETITGGTITIGTEQSEVRSGVRLERIQINCDPGKVDVTHQDIGGKPFRNVPMPTLGSGF